MDKIFEGIVVDVLTDVGLNIDLSVEELSALAAERSAHLATIAGQPGFKRAVIAERDTLALKAGIVAVEQASNAEQRFLDVLGTALTVVAKTIAQ